MASAHEEFWTHNTYAMVGDSTGRKFPLITYRALKEAGKTVYAIDSGKAELDGDKVYQDLKSLPTVPDGVVLELPKDETEKWVKAAAEAGIKNVWIHQKTDTPEALSEAEKRGLKVVSDDSALMVAIESAIAAAPDVADRVRGGNIPAAGALIGAVMKATGGQADAAKVRELLLKHLGQG